MSDNHRADLPDIGKIFESGDPVDVETTVGDLIKKMAAAQRAEHADVIIPADTIVYELLTEEEVDEICREIAYIIFTSPKNFRDDLLAAFAERMSVKLDREQGPPERYFHPDPENISLDFDRLKGLCFQIKGEIAEMKHEIEEGGLGNLMSRVVGAIRNALKAPPDGEE